MNYIVAWKDKKMNDAANVRFFCSSKKNALSKETIYEVLKKRLLQIDIEICCYRRASTSLIESCKLRHEQIPRITCDSRFLFLANQANAITQLLHPVASAQDARYLQSGVSLDANLAVA